MRTATRAWEREYRVFDVGERIRPQDSARAPLPPGVYVVTRCELPWHEWDDASVWVEGREAPVPTTYLTTAGE